MIQIYIKGACAHPFRSLQMKRQAHTPTEIQGAIKAVQTEIADLRPCDSPCRETLLWREVAVKLAICAERLAGMLQDQTAQNQTLAQKNAHMGCSARRSKKVIKELSARANGIHIVPAAEPKEPGRRGRPPGQPATRNKRPGHIDRTETVDLEQCPNGTDHKLSGSVTDTYERVATIWRVASETVLYTVRRRYCRTCKKQVSAPIPGVNRYARTSGNMAAAGATLNMSGLSHGKAAGFISDISNGVVSRSWSYRNKRSTARRMEPAYDDIRGSILEEPYLQCDEFIWPVPGEESGLKNGYALVARGRKSCLVEVSKDRAVDTLNEFLPDYNGVVGQDSYTGWLHAGKSRQMWHDTPKAPAKKGPQIQQSAGRCQNVSGTALQAVQPVHGGRCHKRPAHQKGGRHMPGPHDERFDARGLGGRSGPHHKPLQKAMAPGGALHVHVPACGRHRLKQQRRGEDKQGVCGHTQRRWRKQIRGGDARQQHTVHRMRHLQGPEE